MAVDPTTPVSPILPTPSAGTPPDSSAVLTALARQALANATAQLGSIAGQAGGSATKAEGKVEQTGEAATQDAEHAADVPSPKRGAPAAAAPVARSALETRQTQAVRLATAEAVPRQAGLAPLVADVQAALQLPNAPAEIRDAARALLAVTPTIAEITTGPGLRRAVERSGVLLETRLARSLAPPSADAAARAPVADGDLKAALLMFRSALSAWLGRIERAPNDQTGAPAPNRVSGDAEADAEAPGAAPATPKPLAGYGGRQPSLGLPARERPPGFTPKSGPLEQPASSLGARISTPLAAPLVTIPHGLGTADRPSDSSPPAASLDPDTPTASPVRQPVSSNPTAPAPASAELAARFGPFVAPARSGPERSPPPVAPGKATPPALIQVEHLGEEPPAQDPVTTEPRPLATRAYAPPVQEDRPKTPPPYAGGPMAGQKPAEPTATLGATPEDVARRLLKKAHAALARQDLMQIASLPEAAPQDREQADPRAATPGARLNLDLPFVTPQGVAVAQFEISRYGGGAGGGAAPAGERTYKARFSIDLEPLGPVHALVTLTGARARVSLWAERAETISRLRAGEEALGAALRQAELSPEVAVHSGAPAALAANPLGHFVDQAS